MSNSIKIEKRAVTAVMEALTNCDILNPEINDNDRTQSWDGFVFVYKNEELNKSNLIGRVPVQVKGKKTTYDSPTTLYSLSLTDLEIYYRDRGCILFLVHENTEKVKNKIYYADLLPDELENIIYNTKNKKTISITFYELPKDKKEIEKIFKSFVDYVDPQNRPFIHINEGFLKNNKLSEDEANRLLNEYCKVNSDPPLILKIVCNDLHTHNPSYNRIVEEIYDTAVSSKAPTFLMAAGGTGKSTLLCSVACYAHTVHGIQVLYSNPYLAKKSKKTGFIRQLKRFLLTRPGPTLLCIDESFKSKELISELYSNMECSSNKNASFNDLHILIADRIYWIRDLFFDDLHKFSLWKAKSHALLIENMEHDNPQSTSDMNILSNYFSQDRIRVLYFDSEIRRAIIENMIGHFSVLNDLDPECTEQASQKISLDQKTISDILLDFQRNYNKAAKCDAKPVTSIKWDWEIWYDKLSTLNIQAMPTGKINPKHTFPYIAALTALNVNVSISLLEKMTGIALKDELYELFPQDLADPVRIVQSDILRLRHDTVAANYFAINTERSANECLEHLIKQELFDEKTLINFEKKVFSISKFYDDDPSETDVDIYKLLHIFNKHQNFRMILAKEKRLYSLELALISADMVKNKNSISDPASYIEERLNASFENNLLHLFTEGDYLKTKMIWSKYFNTAIYHCKKIPFALLKPLTKDNNFYKKATHDIEIMLESMTVWLPEEQKQNLYSCAADVFQWILDNINQDDYPSMIHLINIYSEQNEFEKAKKLIEKLCRSNIQNDKVLLIAKSYIKIIKSLKKTDPSNPEINEYIRALVELYESTRQKYPIESRMYITTTCSFARFKKDQFDFDKAHDLLDELLKSKCNNPYIYRAYIELGMLYNTNKKSNKYYNLKTSIDFFNQAWELYQAENTLPKTSKTAFSILKPLAQNYLSDSQYDNTIMICNTMLRHCNKAEDVKKLINKALKLKELPPDKRPRN